MDKEMNPFISIIMTCYNYGHLLQKSLDAIARQTFRDFELVFVDNGCTDNSAEVAKRFSDNHTEISVKIVTVEKNIGPAHGQNVGISAANGIYLMFHDADDWMDDDTLEKLVAAAKKSNADRVISAFRDVDDNGNVLQIQTIAENPIHWLYTMLQANLFKKEIIQKNNISIAENVFGNDAYLITTYNLYVERAEYIYEPCYNYLVHIDSTCRNKDLYKNVENGRGSFEVEFGYFLTIYEEARESDKVWCQYIILMMYYCYIFRFLRDAPLKEKFSKYTYIHKAMLDLFPKYLYNPKISLRYKGGKRRFARIIVWISATLEKLHLFKLGLIGYHILSKYKCFQMY